MKADLPSRRSRLRSSYLGRAVDAANTLGYDRIIVISDEQTADRVSDPITKKAYMINVASNKHGVGYGPWTHIDGFSEQVLRYIHEVEC
jgi:60 kDa SS-A/Ro ribonucleoprotein